MPAELAVGISSSPPQNILIFESGAVSLSVTELKRCSRCASLQQRTGDHRITECSGLEGTSVGHPEQAAQDRVQAGLEYLQRRRRKGKREASSGQKFCLTILTTSAADASPECPEVPSLPTEVINGFSSVAAELGEEETRKTLEKQKCSSPPPRAAWQRTRLVSSHHFNNLPLLFFSPQSFQFQTVQTFP